MSKLSLLQTLQRSRTRIKVSIDKGTVSITEPDNLANYAFIEAIQDDVIQVMNTGEQIAYREFYSISHISHIRY